MVNSKSGTYKLEMARKKAEHEKSKGMPPKNMPPKGMPPKKEEHPDKDMRKMAMMMRTVKHKA